MHLFKNIIRSGGILGRHKWYCKSVKDCSIIITNKIQKILLYYTHGQVFDNSRNIRETVNEITSLSLRLQFCSSPPSFVNQAL
jgi:hypothetical protein